MIPSHADVFTVTLTTLYVAHHIGDHFAVTGANGRKGTYRDIDDLLNELADVAFTAILAIQHFTNDTDSTEHILIARNNYLHTRLFPAARKTREARQQGTERN